MKIKSSVVSDIENSFLFDEDFYLGSYQDVVDSKLNALSHYLKFGAKENRNPNAYFDGGWYKRKYDLSSDVNPLLHYIATGWENNFDPSASFSSKAYKEFYEISSNPLVHYLSEGFEQGNVCFPVQGEEPEISLLAKSGLFDETFYCNANHDVTRSDALLHFCRYGANEDRNPNLFFNSSWYKQRYLVDLDINPLVHYVLIGREKNCNPSFLLDIHKFNSTYGGEVSKEDALVFCLKNFADLIVDDITYDYNRDDVKIILQSRLFSREWFEIKYSDLRGSDGLIHYCLYGHLEGRNPNPFFDSSWYRKTYLDSDEINPLVHYVTEGWLKGCQPSPRFDSSAYVEKYLDGRSTENPLTHFLTIGRNIGCSPILPTVKASFSVSNDSSLVYKTAPDLADIFDFNPRKIAKPVDLVVSNSLDIHFVVPDFGIGGGGHLNIFRMLSFFERFGHKVTIWIFQPKNHINAQSAYENIVRHYCTLRGEVKLLDEEFDNSSGDVIFASSWPTVWPVMSTQKFKNKFYFVQDYEPMFHSRGARSVLAEQSFKFNIDCICASTWLKELVASKYGKWARSFNLAADPKTYYPSVKSRQATQQPKIVLYARMHTERRAVELALIALELMAKKGIDFHVDMYGMSVDTAGVPYSCRIFESRTAEQLGEMYRGADLGIVFSLTNYSLVPQEMMACGLPIVEFDCESTRAVYPDGTVTLAGPMPKDIMRKILYLLANEDERDEQAELALEWVSELTWEGEARKVEAAIFERLSDRGYKLKNNEASIVHAEKPLATVVIPTYNGGDLFKTVLDKVLEQDTPWSYEVIVLDSESTDGTAELAKSTPGVTYKKILKSEFSHGGTRNVGVQMAKGEFVAFLTQDAIPTDDMWLYNLVTILEHYPDAAGVFGRHVAHDNASKYTHHELELHFDGFFDKPLYMDCRTPVPAGMSEEQWMGILRFYSDNNSCLRKSIWQQVPYRNVQYGEDQIWADDVIKAGYGKVYAPNATVKHSHDYEVADVYERAKIDGDFFNYHWQQKMIDEDRIDIVVQTFSEQSLYFGLENGLPDSEIKKQVDTIKAKMRGYLDGANKSVSMFAIESDEKSKF